MGRKLAALALIGICFLAFTLSFAEDETERILVLRHAQERGKTTVAIEAYLIGNVLETAIYVRMYATKPKIFNVILVGPRLGRLGPRTKETIYPKAEEEEEISFPTTDVRGGYIRFSKRTQNKVSRGTLTRELVKFRVPVEKILSNRRYELRILVESTQNPGKTEPFTFVLKDFAELLKK